MSEAPESPVLRDLRRMDEKGDRLTEEVHDLKLRVSSPERQVAEVVSGQAALHSRMDRLETRIERIEHRLDLVEYPNR